LEYDDELDAAAFEPPSDLHHFAKVLLLFERSLGRLRDR